MSWSKRLPLKLPLKIFIGYDPREHVAYEVAKYSIERRASVPVLVSPVVLDSLPEFYNRPVSRLDERLWCPISEAPMATEFANSRFCVPHMQKRGWALFVDCDVLCLADIADLFALADEKYAVMVVKHDELNCIGTKMDGVRQTKYLRKNWSSVVLWNCDHPSNKNLTPHIINSWPGRDLHAFKWLDDSEIGTLPPEWNHLVGVESGPAKIFHYTLGGPWIKDWKRGDFDDLWLLERVHMDQNRTSFAYRTVG